MLDPIDGTKSFIHGVPLYTTLVAVLENDVQCVGVIHGRLLAETVYAATGAGAGIWRRGGQAASGEGFDGCEVEGGAGADLRDGWVCDTRGSRCDGGVIATAADGAADADLGRWLRLFDGGDRAGRGDDRSGDESVGCGAAADDPEEAGGQFTDWRGEATSTRARGSRPTAWWRRKCWRLSGDGKHVFGNWKTSRLWVRLCFARALHRIVLAANRRGEIWQLKQGSVQAGSCRARTMVDLLAVRKFALAEPMALDRSACRQFWPLSEVRDAGILTVSYLSEIVTRIVRWLGNVQRAARRPSWATR